MSKTEASKDFGKIFEDMPRFGRLWTLHLMKILNMQKIVLEDRHASVREKVDKLIYLILNILRLKNMLIKLNFVQQQYR